ncbi:amino acid ABC transporter permease [Herbiconiux sp. VKM Ac-2851]|uniref:amino acid ABC transporter permease n=1 Tax=Herbiconiux sp. VKM Ac-2851 TaxID=2739025 RepID=UPI001563295B|nr:amino acid ABC transporter permease [Herbiconiux sp. VKM Ac-2851]NQX37032.1 amino acid ABC transporter permease [Herbiconiux sp. VKM Ac-2851]
MSGLSTRERSAGPGGRASVAPPAAPGDATATGTPGAPLPPGIDFKRLAERPVVPLRHPVRWVITAVVLVLLLNFVQTLFTNPAWEWSKVGTWLFAPAILKGLQLTLLATAISAVVSFLGGIVVALGRISGNPVLSTLSWLYIWLFRSVPLILVLIFLFNLGNLYPTIGIGVPFGPQLELPTVTVLSSLALGVIGLSLSEIAYSAEVVRSGILAVDQGQHEAAKALGIPSRRQFTRIVLPQALRSIVPAYVNQIIGLLKASSLLFYVSLLDLFGVVQNLGSTYPTDIIPLLVVATIWYLVLTSVISVVQYYIERFYARGSVRVLPATPWQRFRGGVRQLSRRPAVRPHESREVV